MHTLQQPGHTNQSDEDRAENAKIMSEAQKRMGELEI